MPPPAHSGERTEPARARPVPFWRHGFAPPPATSPRVFVEAVPRRRAFSSARTVSCTSGMLKPASNAPASRVTVPPPSFGALRGELLALAIGPDLHRPAAGPGHGAPDQQQVLLGQHVDHGQATLGDPAPAHPAGTAQPLEYTGGRGGGADRARRPDVVRAVGGGAPLEVVALDRALEALALGAPRDLHLVAGGERVRGHRLAHEQLAHLVAELSDMPVGTCVGLLQVTELGFGE